MTRDRPVEIANIHAMSNARAFFIYMCKLKALDRLGTMSSTRFSPPFPIKRKMQECGATA